MSEGNGKIRRRRWTDAEDQMIREQYDSASAAGLADLMDRTENAVWLRARTLGLEKREEFRPWTDAELSELQRCYALEPATGIARRLGRSASAVSQQARSLGLTGRKMRILNAVVHDYFEAVTTAEQAYILGLLAADGCVSSRHPRVIFGLQAKDAGLVEWVRDRLNPEASMWRSRKGFAKIQITSRQMVEDLARFGIVPRKSRILAWPAMPGDLQRPYLLGYFDGDGSMYLPRDRHRRQRPGWTVCSGSEQFLIDMKDYIRAVTGVELQKIQHRKKSGLWQVAVTGCGAAVLDEFLHRDGLGLERKRFPERVLVPYRR